MLQLKCTGQEMKVAIDERIADKYINANKVHFEFCERWAGMTITAQFTQKQKDEETQEEVSKTYNVVVDPVSYTVVMPNEIKAGEVFISAFGVHPSTGVRITSVPIKKTVDKSGFVGDGDTPIPPTPDLYAQLIKNLNPTGANRQYVSDSDGKAQWAALNIKAGHAHGSLVGAGAEASNVGTYSVALGSGTKATGNTAFAFGSTTDSSGDSAFSTGVATKASGTAAFASGYSSEATGDCSSAEGYGLRAYSPNQHVQGKWNKEDSEERYAHIVGNGEDGMSRSNAHTLDWDGNAWFKGKVFVGGTSMDDATELGTGGGSGTGLPTPAGANMQLVTDKDGKWTQTERLAYPITGTVEILSKAPIVNTQIQNGMIAALFNTPLNGTIEVGKTYEANFCGYKISGEAKSINIGEVATVIGNASLFGGEDTGEAYAVVVVPDALVADTGGTVMVAAPTGFDLSEGDGEYLTITGEGATYKKVSFDYLPEGVGGVESGYVLSEVTLTASEDFDGQMTVTNPLSSTLVTGQTYTVMWNGAKYDCPVVIADGMAGLGNVGLMTGGADTGEPFIFAVALDGFTDDSGTPIYAIVMPLDGSTTATVSISGETIKKIDPKYIDLEWIPEMQEVGEQLLPLTTLRKAGDSYSIVGFSDKLSAGMSVIVFADGERFFTSVREPQSGVFIIGNGSGVDGIDTNMPFNISTMGSDSVTIGFTTDGIHRIEMYATGNDASVPNTLPDRYFRPMTPLIVNAYSTADLDATPLEIYSAFIVGRPVYCIGKSSQYMMPKTVQSNYSDFWLFAGGYEYTTRIDANGVTHTITEYTPVS